MSDPTTAEGASALSQETRAAIELKITSASRNTQAAEEDLDVIQVLGKLLENYDGPELQINDLYALGRNLSVLVKSAGEHLHGVGFALGAALNALSGAVSRADTAEVAT